MRTLAERKAVRDQVKGCVSCGLRAGCREPVPFDAPLSGVGIVVVGEAPGYKEDQEGVPFVGPAGQLARQWLTRVGINTVDVAWMNVVCCFPNRTPTTKEVTACRPNLTAQIEYLDPKFVLVFGGVALSALCPVSTKISESAGYFWRPSYKTSAWAMATWHPAAVLRNVSLEDKALEDLEYFSLVAKEEVDQVEHVYCLKCKKNDVWQYHSCGLGFCENCWRLSVK